jgi:hypothetical protein
MRINDNVALADTDRADEPFSFEVSDVTGSLTVVASDVPRGIPAGDVATALARRMALPSDVPWTLRDESSAAYLDDDVPIGAQLADESKVTITPKTHLG